MKKKTTQQSNKTALILFSGGQDSTTCLYWAIAKFKKVVALGFDYGQRHSNELNVAKSLTQSAGVEFIVLKLPLLNELTDNALTRKDVTPDAVSGKEYGPAKNEQVIPNTLVEGRNMLFLTYAAIYAKNKGITDLVAGVSEADNSGYSDCREDFIKSLETTLSLSNNYPYKIHTPLMWLDKATVWKLAADLKIIDIIKNKTITCYNGIIADGCGNCKACNLRTVGYKNYLKSLT